MERLACLAIGYMCGSFLTADVVARIMRKRSIFVLGDGNPGMANVGRELGRGAALVCLAGDILKTVLPIVISYAAFPQIGKLAIPWAGVGATLGHIFPFWHGFKGGKGVATIASTIILMDPVWGLLSGAVGVASIVVSGYLSVAAVVAMASYTAAMLLAGHPEFALASFLFMLLTVLRHWSKLQGIREGTTSRAGLSIRFWNRMRRR